MPQTDLVNIPSATSMLTTLGSSSSPMFNELLPIGLVVTGFVVGGMVVYILIHGFTNGISSVVHGMTNRSTSKYD